MKSKRTLIVTLAILLVSFGIVQAATNSLRLDWWSVDGGAGQLVSAENRTLTGTIAQADAGSRLASTNGRYGLTSGFNTALAAIIDQFFPILLVAEPGYDNIRLTWNSTNDPAVTQYRIKRATGQNSTLTTIFEGRRSHYFDRDLTLQTGTEYCYQLEALRTDGTIALTSNLSCAETGKLSVWVSEVWAKPGTEALIPFNMHNAENLQMAVGEVHFEFYDGVIQPIGVESTAMTAEYDWSLSVISDYQARVVTHNQNIDPVALRGDGALFWLRVNVIGAEGSETAINLAEFVQGVGGTAFYTPNNLLTPIPIELTGSTFHADALGAYRLGDLNGDGVVASNDALIALQIANNTITPTAQQLYAGDVNSSGGISAADASMIFFYAVNDYWPPVNLLSTGSPSRMEQAPVTVTVGNGFGLANSTVNVPISLSAVTNLAGARLILAFDDELVTTVGDVTVTGIVSDFDVAQRDLGNGLLSIAFAEELEVAGSGQILDVPLVISADVQNGTTSPLTIVEAYLNDSNGRDFEQSSLQTTLNYQDGILTINNVPTAVAFDQFAVETGHGLLIISLVLVGLTTVFLLLRQRTV